MRPGCLAYRRFKPSAPKAGRASISSSLRLGIHHHFDRWRSGAPRHRYRLQAVSINKLKIKTRAGSYKVLPLES